jgi:hypothetical protein
MAEALLLLPGTPSPAPCHRHHRGVHPHAPRIHIVVGKPPLHPHPAASLNDAWSLSQCSSTSLRAGSSHGYTRRPHPCCSGDGGRRV